MKKFMCFMIVCTLMISIVSPCFANNYSDQMRDKYVRGFTNVFSSFAEVGRGMSNGINESESPFFGGLIGVFTGAGSAIVRAASGIYDIVVAPIPGIMTFPPEPETLFDTGIEVSQK